LSRVQGGLRGQAIALMERVLRDGGPIAPEYPLGLDARFGGRIVTIEEDGRVLSACALLVRDFVIGTHLVRCGLIGSVCTAPEARGRGLATELLRRAEAELASEGCVLAMLWADEARFYDERGWRPVGAEVDFAFEPAQESRLAAESGIRAAALDDRGAIHRLYTLHRERVERSPAETAALLDSPGLETLVLQRDRDVVAYSCRGRGKDFDRTVHEWAGSDRDVLALVREHMLRSKARGEHGPTFLITPPGAKSLHERLRGLGIRWNEGVLAMGKLLDVHAAAALVAQAAGEAAQVSIEDGVGEDLPETIVALAGPRARLELTPDDLLGLLVPARGRRLRLEEVERACGLSLASLPLPLFAWGLDSI
jgi:GNAT superfamily N-acetyltransferase